MGRNRAILLLILLLLFGGCSSASPTPAKIVGGVVSNVASALCKWLWSLKPTPKTVVSSRSLMKFEGGYTVETVFDGSKIGIEPHSLEISPNGELLVLDAENSNIYKISTPLSQMWPLLFVNVVSSRSLMKFEGGYTVETVFDGSKIGIEPHSLEISPNGELLVLDAENSNIYKISTPLSRYSRPKLVAGSPEGYSGHVDGRPREARLNHPKGLTVDDRGNIYVADTMNMAIRKISDAGVVTIAGGKWGHGGGHVDGPSEEAKFSNDFDVVYSGSSCSILVVDRGNQAIREIQLHDDDCSDHYDGDLHLGIAVLAAAMFFGYMLALLQRRVAAMFSSHNDPRASMNAIPPATYHKPLKSVRPPLIPTEDDSEKSEAGLFGSLGRFFLNAASSVFGIFGGLFFRSRKKPLNNYIHQHFQQPPNQYSNTWPIQDLENTRQFKQSQSLYGGWNGNFQQQQQLQHQRHYSSGPETYYEQNCETNEIVFGAVQEQDGRRAVVIKAVDYGDPMYNNHNIRSRYNYSSYSNGY